MFRFNMLGNWGRKAKPAPSVRIKWDTGPVDPCYPYAEGKFSKSSSSYITWLRKKGFEHLGSGAFSTVLGHPKSDRVIKVCHNPDAWIDYVYWGAKQGYAGKFVPKVYSFKKHPDFYVAVMEKLAYTATYADSKTEAYVTNTLFSLGIECKNETAKQLLDLLAPGAEAFSNALRERFKGQRLDIHGGNIMFRKDGGMVVVDPVCHEFSQHWVRLREKHFSPVTFH